MTVITDVPNSGIYFQAGAITDLVVQIIDINTGLPVQLQTATGLSISILYPDLITSQTFNALLYSDGSDGRISYITQSSDLSQIGLYQIQGDAVIGGYLIPPSYLTDFYVLQNVMGGSVPPAIASPSALILFDSNNVRWATTVSPSGIQSTASQAYGPSVFFQPTSLVMKDQSGIYWTISVSTTGVLIPIPGGSFPNAVENFILTDLNGKSWIMTISDDGSGLEAA